MKINQIITEDGKIVPGVNTTVDVKPGETERQARKFFGGNGKPKPLSGSNTHKLFNMGLVNENEIVDKHATTPDQTLFDLTGNIANWNGWVKHPKHGILGFSTNDGDDGSQVQRWLNNLGYEVEQDGVIGPQTTAALNDAIGKIRSGEISLQPTPAAKPAPTNTPTTAIPKAKTSTSNVDALRAKRAHEFRQKLRRSIK